MNRAAINGLLLVAVTVAATLAWLSRPAADRPAGAAWIELPEPADSIRALQDGELRFALARTADGWWLQHPFRRPALATRAGHLLGLAEVRPEILYPRQGFDLAGAGLAPAAWTLQLGSARVEFGAAAPLGAGRYLLSGERIAVLPDQWLPLLQAGPRGLADLRLWPHGSALTRVETPLARLRRTDGDWRSADPGVALATAAATTLAEAWNRAAALTIRPADARPAIGQARLADGDGRSIEYELVEDPDGLGLRATADGYQLLVDAELADRLLHLPAPGDL